MKNGTLTLPLFAPALSPAAAAAPVRALSLVARRHPARDSGAWMERQGEAPQALRDKGSKAEDGFEVWHHHVDVGHPAELARLLQFDQRR